MTMAERNDLPAGFEEVVALANSEASLRAIRETGSPPAEVAEGLRELRSELATHQPHLLARLYARLRREPSEWLADHSVPEDFKARADEILETNRDAFRVLAEM